MPTERRTRSAGTSRAEPATEACVIRPGCSISDSTPPSDSPRVNSRGAVADLDGRLLAARDPEGHHAAERPHLLGGDLVAGVLGQPRVEHLGHARRAGSACRRPARRSRCAGPCAPPSVLMPRSTSQESKGPATAPIAFWWYASSSPSSCVADDQRAADDVRVAAHVLGRGVHDDVRAERQRLLEVRAWRRCCRRRAARPRRGRPRRPPAMSVMPSSGLVGVSTQTTLVFGVMRGAYGGRVAGVGDRPLHAPPLRRPWRTGGTCRRTRRWG